MPFSFNIMTQDATLTIARVFVDEVLECAHRARIDVDVLLADLELGHGMLDEITSSQLANVWLEISQRMGDEFFGLGERPMASGSFTLMGHAVRDAKTVEVALRRALRFLKVVLGEPYGEMTISDGLCTVKLIERETARSAFAYRTFFLILHGLNCWLARERIALQAIQFPCLEPATNNDYGDFFGAPVQFGAKVACISFDAKYLRRPVRRSEEDLKTFLRTTPESLLRGYRATLGLKARIQSICLVGDVEDWPSSDSIAGQFGFSRSTLHRKLRDQGQSIKSIKGETRRSHATYLLKTTNLPIGQIAEKVGYAEPSAFYRSFRKWYGTTPKRMRQASTSLEKT